MAIDSVPQEQLSAGKNKHLKDLYDGLTMTSARLLQVILFWFMKLLSGMSVHGAFMTS